MGTGAAPELRTRAGDSMEHLARAPSARKSTTIHRDFTEVGFKNASVIRLASKPHWPCVAI
jgi:hypothetical protein